MEISICKFQVRGWLASEPKVIHRLDKDGVEYVSAVVRISIPRVKPDENCVFKRCGYDVVSVAVHGTAAEQIERDAADPARRWRRGDLVEIKGYLVPASRRAPRGRDFLGRRLTQSYRLRTNNSQNIINDSAHERRRRKTKGKTGGSNNLKCTTIAPGRRASSGKTSIGQAIEVDYYDF